MDTRKLLVPAAFLAVEACAGHHHGDVEGVLADKPVALEYGDDGGRALQVLEQDVAYQDCANYAEARLRGEKPDWDLSCEPQVTDSKVVSFDMGDIASENRKNFLKASLAEEEGAEPRLILSHLMRGLDTDGKKGMQPDEVYASGNTIDLQPGQYETVDMFGVFIVTPAAGELNMPVVGLCAKWESGDTVQDLTFGACYEGAFDDPSKINNWGDSYRWWPTPFMVSAPADTCSKIVFALGTPKQDGSYEIFRDVDGREVLKVFFVTDTVNTDCFSSY